MAVTVYGYSHQNRVGFLPRTVWIRGEVESRFSRDEFEAHGRQVTSHKSWLLTPYC